MKRYIGRAAQAILIIGIFCLTLLFTLPLGALSGLIAANLPEGVDLEEPRGRLLDGRATALIFEPRPGWPLRFEPLNWHLGLDGWRPELHLGIGDGWALDARLEGLSVAWRLEGGDLAALDTSALPVGSGIGLDGRLEGQLEGRMGPGGCLAAEGQLTGPSLQLKAPEIVPLERATLSLACAQGQDAWHFTLGEPEDVRLRATHSLLGGHGELNARLPADHPLLTYWRLLDPRVTPGEQSRQW
ncbi:hypothetical protein [Halomonas caseinilytica]|uniref:General secretion pathway protein N n=1 Tax=Halomonas caseinilytica TaxID=438744 RepID=A0A1M6MQM8_9GAMM|nr:hypothetical protein [Halomonas caseinilytica]SHJ85825.1 hypothetical protein SAMN05192556_101129 [Halomonas caseinilytica]